MFASRDNEIHELRPYDSDLEALDKRPSQAWVKGFSYHSALPEATSTEATQRILQDGRPTFVPTFSWLRETCIQHTAAKLQHKERQIRAIPDHSSQHRLNLIDEALLLLKDLDRQFQADVARHQLEDPTYADDHGVQVSHFEIPDGERRGDWTMLASNWGIKSRSITESNPKQLSELHQNWISDFAGGRLPQIVAFKRPKTILERQPKAVKVENSVIVPRLFMKKVWAAAFCLAIFCLFLFFAVGVVATTTTFSPTFVKTFFWIAIIWTFASSSLLSWLVRAFGASSRDCVSAFLACIAIWLVVIQIGQTHLGFQDPTGAGIAFNGGG